MEVGSIQQVEFPTDLGNNSRVGKATVAIIEAFHPDLEPHSYFWQRLTDYYNVVKGLKIIYPKYPAYIDILKFVIDGTSVYTAIFGNQLNFIEDIKTVLKAKNISDDILASIQRIATTEASIFAANTRYDLNDAIDFAGLYVRFLVQEVRNGRNLQYTGSFDSDNDDHILRACGIFLKATKVATLGTRLMKLSRAMQKSEGIKLGNISGTLIFSVLLLVKRLKTTIFKKHAHKISKFDISS